MQPWGLELHVSHVIKNLLHMIVAKDNFYSNGRLLEKRHKEIKRW
jgi:hypothetical protein